MSQNPSFYNHFQSKFTFQNVSPRFSAPPPPPAPKLTPEISGEEFIRKFKDCIPPAKPKAKVSLTKICDMKISVLRLLRAFQDIKLQEKFLSSKTDFSDDEWQSMLQNIEINKNVLRETIIKMSRSGLDVIGKLITKRRAKRLRLKKKRCERQEERKEKIRQREENSRKIDENLQKIKDDIQKAKQEEEAKFQADVVLKDVRRKKNDAKKSIAKLESLVKLRRARENTAKGKGQLVSDAEINSFQENIERLKSLWEHKLASYEKEEEELRATLEKQSVNVNDTEVQASNIMKWRKALFGGKDNPQVDFNGDVQRFIAVRAQWDQFIDDGPKSTPIPIGWVCPNLKK